MKDFYPEYTPLRTNRSQRHPSNFRRDLPLHQRRPRDEEDGRTDHIHHPREDDDLRERRPVAEQRARDRIAAQGGKAHDGEDGSVPDADFPDVADLREAGGHHGDERAGAEAVEGGEDDDRRVAARGQPEGEDDDGAEEVEDDDDVEAAEAVAQVAGERAPEDGRGVEHGEEVVGEVLRHAQGLAGQLDEGERDEDAEEDEEGAEGQEGEGRFAERLDEGHKGERLGAGWQP